MRRRRTSQQPGMSLFPFLAVLICTMGSLIVLLVLVVQQARVDAAAPPIANVTTAQPEPEGEPPPSAESDKSVDRTQQRAEAEQLYRDRVQERDEHLWRKNILQTERQEKLNMLSETRLKLGHLEDHIRQLETRWKELQAEGTLLESQSGSSDTSQQLADLDRQRSALEQQLNERQQELASRPPSFAVIPYEGLSGTQRRPIYLECTAQGVAIQPAGITLSPADFVGPSTAGNPLEAALRTIREYWRETGLLADSEPYPLLLVRPSGVEMYGTARNALKTWDDEFGYELVGDEKNLAFPTVDPVLAEQVQQAVATAKQRQEVLAAAMPKAYKQQQAVAMRASANGGFVPVGGGEDEMREQAERALAGRSATASTSLSGGADSAPQTAEEAASQNVRGGAAPANSTPIATQRGANWALLSASPGATGWSRPVQVICSADRLVVLQERGGLEPSRTIMTNGEPLKHIDSFVEVVRKHVEGWGSPPPNGYWKPMLFVQVQPGADNAFRSLQSLMQDSGFELKRIEN